MKKDENEAFWLGWYCVNPDYRGRGVGTRLIDFSIAETKKLHKKFLRLYTSNRPNESMAQSLFDKKGFIKFFEEPEHGTEYKWMYKQLKIE